MSINLSSSWFQSVNSMFLLFKGVREWAEILGIMTDKETQGDEEVLIYAMTLINKVYIYMCSCTFK